LPQLEQEWPSEPKEKPNRQLLKKPSVFTRNKKHSSKRRRRPLLNLEKHGNPLMKLEELKLKNKRRLLKEKKRSTEETWNNKPKNKPEKKPNLSELKLNIVSMSNTELLTQRSNTSRD
jgi:hypothetical protein